MDVRRAGAIALTVLGFAFRLCAIALCAIVVILCFSGLSARLNMVGFVVDLSRLLPAFIAGNGVITTPFGGVFRLDFSLIALLFFLLDYACLRCARMLRS